MGINVNNKLPFFGNFYFMLQFCYEAAEYPGEDMRSAYSAIVWANIA